MKTVMKISLLITALSSLVSCNARREYGDVVEERYVHLYGAEVPPEKWAASGEHGQVVSTLRNGVTITKNYNAGVLDGQTTYTFPHSEFVEKTEHYSRGVLVQETIHHLSGAPREEIVYSDNNTKVITTWYENGSPQYKEGYEGNLLVYGEYYNPQHQVDSRVQNREGSRIVRDQYGIVISTDVIKDGQMVVRTTYYPNGSPKTITPYVDGIVEGQRKTYLPAGEPCTVEAWSGGLQDGLTFVYQNGEKHAEVPYARGSREGIERRFRNGSDVIEEIYWLDDKRHGPDTSYIGTVSKTDWFFQDRPVSQAQFDLNHRKLAR